jgi:hypothetical protein
LNGAINIVVRIFDYQVSVNFGRPVKLGLIATSYGYSSSVMNVRKVTDKIKNVTGKVINSCQSSFSTSEAMVLGWCSRGDRVLDLCSGVGTVAVACAVNGIHVTCVEADPTQCRVTHQRLLSLVENARDAFDKHYKLPQADLVDCSIAPNVCSSFPTDSAAAKTVCPYLPSGQNFSFLSFKVYDPILVSFVLFVCVFVLC